MKTKDNEEIPQLEVPNWSWTEKEFLDLLFSETEEEFISRWNKMHNN